MAGKERIYRTLRAVPIFAGLTDDELDAIDGLLTEVNAGPGAILIREGDAGREFVIIVEGSVAITRAGEPVVERGAGSFVGELALLDGAPRSATVTATSVVRAFVLNRGEFESLLSQAPGLREKVEHAARARRV